MVVPLPCENPDTVILTNFLLWGPVITHVEQNFRPGRSIRYLLEECPDWERRPRKAWGSLLTPAPQAQCPRLPGGHEAPSPPSQLVVTCSLGPVPADALKLFISRSRGDESTVGSARRLGRSLPGFSRSPSSSPRRHALPPAGHRVVASRRAMYFTLALFAGSYSGSIFMPVPFYFCKPILVSLDQQPSCGTWLTLPVALLETVFDVKVIPLYRWRVCSWRKKGRYQEPLGQNGLAVLVELPDDIELRTQMTQFSSKLVSEVSPDLTGLCRLMSPVSKVSPVFIFIPRK